MATNYIKQLSTSINVTKHGQIKADMASYVSRLPNKRNVDAWQDMLEFIESDILPSGSGFDLGCSVNVELSTTDKIVIDTSFHHMDENGFYDGWTEHRVTLTPSFDCGMNVNIDGEDRNDIHDYIAEMIYDSLMSESTATISRFLE